MIGFLNTCFNEIDAILDKATMWAEHKGYL